MSMSKYKLGRCDMTTNETNKTQGSGGSARSHYDKLSKWYDLFATRSERAARIAGMEMLEVKEGNAVLEIGSGTGQSILALAESAGSPGRVWGVDISEGMISRSKINIRRAGQSERIGLACGDAMNLPFRSGTCDRIFMSFTLELFDSSGMLRVLSECQRVLGQGGKICVVALAKQANPGLLARLYDRAHKKFPNFIDCRPIAIQGIVSDAGFRILRVSEMDIWSLPVGIVLAER